LRNSIFTDYLQLFFTPKAWYLKLPEATKNNVRDLLARGRLIFVNGGWSMHDEASSHYLSMIDQTTLGHKFLLDEFGFVPRIGWQIDPFGHSSTVNTHTSL